MADEPPEAPHGAPQENDSSSSRTFSLDVQSAGAHRLRCTVKTKLPEFMGNADDVLAEYVVVLVGHGKQRKQATADLEAFLGSQSEAFVSWLWDHLTENLHDYVETSDKDQVPRSASSKDQVPKSASSKDEVPISASNKDQVPKSASNKDQVPKSASDKDQVPKPAEKQEAPVQSLQDGPTQVKANEETVEKTEDANKKELKRDRSPEPWSRRRRTRTENKEVKTDVSQPEEKPPEKPTVPRLNASRRLLEFAVRDAVQPAAPAVKRTVDFTSNKRLRSVVAADHENPVGANGKLKARPTISKQARSSPAIMIALKAAAAAAEDVTKSKTAAKPVKQFTPASVWDRLGGQSDEELQDQQSLEDEITEKLEYVHMDSRNNRHDTERQHIRKSTDRVKTSDTYEDGHSEERRTDEIPEYASNKKEYSRKHGVRKERRQKKPEDYKRVSHIDGDVKHKDIQPMERRHDVEHANEDVTEMKKRMKQVEMEVTKLRDEANKGTEKPAANTGVKEDADSRTVMVTNVHFATTKEAISAHFASCGEVLKVTMLNDTVGKPKGSAYVEFTSKEAAEKALAMTELSLLSRPLRVVRKDANVAETSTSTAAAALPAPRPPMIRPVRMPMRAFSRSPFMRSSPYMLRPPPRLPVGRPPFPSAPHLQWKRDGGSTTPAGPQGKNGFRSNVGGPIRHKRSLSYVRPAVQPSTEAAAASTEEQKGS